MKKASIIVVGVIVVLFVGLFTCYKVNLGSVSKKSEEVNFNIISGTNSQEIIKNLKNADLIKNEFFSKVYLKLHNNIIIKAGKYSLNRNMNAKEIFSKLSVGGKSDNTIRITFKEGDIIENYIKQIGEGFNLTEDEIKNKINSETFLKPLISKYWFLTDDILNQNIKYALEGYLYPNTYEFYKDASIDDVIKKMLDQTEKELNDYKKEMINSPYSIHEIMTLASIIEKEAGLAEDRKTISGVFYNRLNKNMALQSCATLGYALGKWKLRYTTNDTQVDSPYNTYKYPGFPPGPTSNPSIGSIEAAIYPEDTDYLYFLADVCHNNHKTYFSKTYEEHEKLKHEKLNCN